MAAIHGSLLEQKGVRLKRFASILVAVAGQIEGTSERKGSSVYLRKGKYKTNVNKHALVPASFNTGSKRSCLTLAVAKVLQELTKYSAAPRSAIDADLDLVAVGAGDLLHLNNFCTSFIEILPSTETSPESDRSSNYFHTKIPVIDALTHVCCLTLNSDVSTIALTPEEEFVARTDRISRALALHSLSNIIVCNTLDVSSTLAIARNTIAYLRLETDSRLLAPALCTLSSACQIVINRISNAASAVTKATAAMVASTLAQTKHPVPLQFVSREKQMDLLFMVTELTDVLTQDLLLKTTISLMEKFSGGIRNIQIFLLVYL